MDRCTHHECQATPETACPQCGCKLLGIGRIDRWLMDMAAREHAAFMSGVPQCEPLGVLGAKVIADCMTEEELAIHGDPSAPEPQGVFIVEAK